jgi:LmbE family N-acetylglucosaminyl deacetylase
VSLGLPARTAIVAPHLDDGVLSLGATIYRSSRAGSYIRVITVFAGDPESDRPASGWDSLPGFATEGEAVRIRREEDAEACGVVGADRLYLRFSEPVYAGPPDWVAVSAEVNEALSDVDVALVPGFPLIHRDHRWLTENLLAHGLEVPRVGLYAEQPYRHQKARFRRVGVDADLSAFLPEGVDWHRAGTGLEPLRAKHRAVSAYRSQRRWLDLDGSKLGRMLWFEAIRGGEAVAWVYRSESDERPG